MKKTSILFIVIGLIAIVFTAGFLPGNVIRNIGSFCSTFIFTSNEACAHPGGTCFVDANNVATMADRCRSACDTTYASIGIKKDACKDGCAKFHNAAIGIIR